MKAEDIRGRPGTERTSLENYLLRIKEIPGPFSRIENTPRLRVMRADAATKRADFAYLQELDLGLPKVDPDLVITHFNNRPESPLRLVHKPNLAGMEQEIFMEKEVYDVFVDPSIEPTSLPDKKIVKVLKTPLDEHSGKERIHIWETARLVLGGQLIPQMYENGILEDGHVYGVFEMIPQKTIEEIRALQEQVKQGKMKVHGFADALHALTKHDIQLEFDAKDEANLRLKVVGQEIYQPSLDNVLYAVQIQDILDPRFLTGLQSLAKSEEGESLQWESILYHIQALRDLQEPIEEDEKQKYDKINKSINTLRQIVAPQLEEVITDTQAA